MGDLNRIAEKSCLILVDSSVWIDFFSFLSGEALALNYVALLRRANPLP